MAREAELPPTEEAALDPEADTEAIKAKQRNSLAMAYLLSAFKAQADVSLAYETMDDDWPGGLAYKVVEKLQEIYKPSDNVTEVELYDKLLSVKMKKKEDPKTLFEQLATIQNWYNNGSRKIAKSQLIAVALKAAPDDYASVLTSEQEKQGDNLELSHLRAVMNKYFRAVHKGRKGKDDDDEMALTNQDETKTKSSTKKKKFNGKCNNCGKQGHMARDCWLDPKNASKRPDWFKGTEVNAAGASEEKKSTELQLVNINWGRYEAAFAEEDEESFSDDNVTTFGKNDDNDWCITCSEENKCETKNDPVGATEVALKAVNDKTSMELLEDPEVFVIDTGATCHSTGKQIGLIDLEDAKGSSTRVGSGERLSSKAVAKMPFITKDGTKGCIGRMHLIPGAPFNLISGTKLLTMGYAPSGDANHIAYTKGDSKLVFDIKIKSPEGMLLATRLKRTATEVGGAAANEAQNKMVNIQHAHEVLGHMDEAATRKAAKALGWIITPGSLRKCESCAISKAKQKNVKGHGPTEKHKDVNGRVYLDMSRLVKANSPNQPRRPNWCMMVDEKTGYKSSSFHETKADMKQPVCAKLANWRDNLMPVQILRMDNGGENKGLVKMMNSSRWKLYPTIEYTARDTPQHNHMVEVGFATIYGRGRAMMNDAHIPDEWRPVVAQKAMETATLLDGLVPVTIEGVTKTRVEHWSGAMPKFAQHLRKWGEAGVVKIKTNTTPKLSDRGITCMFVGYAKNHSGDCYEMLNVATKRILETRDVQWLGRMYFDKNVNNAAQHESQSADNHDNDEDELDNEQDEVDEVAEGTLHDNDDGDGTPSQVEHEPHPSTATTTKSGRIVRPSKRYIEEIEGITVDEIMAVGAGIGGGFIHTSELRPMKYEEAMATPKAKEWEKAVEKEYQRMVDHGVFKTIKMKDVPKNAKILSSTWAMKQKADGTLRARLNARGFEQRPGEHYDETGISSPVVNEASIFIILILMIMAAFDGELNDVKGAFLNGLFSMGEKLYMYVPKGMEKFFPMDVILLLLKTIYGLKQAAFEYWRALLKAIKTVGLLRSNADPCVYFRWTDNGLNLWASWVDDLLSCGRKKDIEQGRKAIKQHFDLDEIGELKEYVGCKIEYNKEQGWMKLTQPVLIQSFDDEFDMPNREYKTPAAPNSMLTEGTSVLDEAKHSEYRKGVGKLIHLSKYTRPEILNAVRELSRFGSKPCMAHYAAMIRTMRYCTLTRERGLLLKPNKKWDGKDRDFLFEITGKSDSDFAKCPTTRRSVSGWVTYLNGAPYVRKSKMQRFVTLSVTEAECVAATSCVQDMMYGKNFLESLGLKVKLPMTLYMDNKGGVDIFNNWSIAGNTRAVSIRFAYIRELKEAGILQIKWLQGGDNTADLLTKNLDGPTFERHSNTMIN